jgi:hypothetical protein
MSKRESIRFSLQTYFVKAIPYWKSTQAFFIFFIFAIPAFSQYDDKGNMVSYPPGNPFWQEQVKPTHILPGKLWNTKTDMYYVPQLMDSTYRPIGWDVLEENQQKVNAALSQNNVPTQLQIMQKLENERRGIFEKSKQELEIKEFQDIENENLTESPTYKIADMKELNAIASLKGYREALEKLNGMANGKTIYSIKQAVFTCENAYYKNTLSYELYNTDIQKLVAVCKIILKKHGYSEKNPDACHWAIQKLFSDTIRLGSGKIRQPFGYDFEDFFGEQDWTKMFVTKLLRTHTGQCHSMPLLYLILAEELHCDAFLSLAPEHSFIQYQDKNGTWYNFETTIGKLTTRSFALGSGKIAVEALANKVYLSPLTHVQTLSMCISDLGMGFRQQFGLSDFVIDCANAAKLYHENNLFALSLQNDFNHMYVKKLSLDLGRPKASDIDKYPKLKEAVTSMIEWQQKIADIGYSSKSSPAEYKKWLLSAKEEKNVRESSQLSLKAKQNLKQ